MSEEGKKGEMEGEQGTTPLGACDSTYSLPSRQSDRVPCAA